MWHDLHKRRQNVRTLINVAIIKKALKISIFNKAYHKVIESPLHCILSCLNLVCSVEKTQ